jgi:HKD family nuclease
MEASVARKRLLNLIEKCKSFKLATAWATDAYFIEKAITSGRMTHFVLGTNMYVTSPDVIERCFEVPEAKVMYPNDKPMFHPKLYAFDLGDKLEVYVGSSNLTNGGLKRNIECGVFLRNDKSSASLETFMDHIDVLWKGAKEIDEDFVASYRANYRSMKDAKAKLKEFVRLKRPTKKGRSANDINPQEMDWATFVQLTKNDQFHSVDKRLNVLKHARQLFASGLAFSEMEEIDRRCIAGLIKPPTRFEVNWGFFGQMSAFGQYSPIMHKHYKLFSKALDHIPLNAPVKRHHYESYVEAFKKVPGASKTWEGMGTRLLAMKRPDYFVCIDNENREGLCDNFGCAPTTTNLDNYWDRIIAPMCQTPWWQTDQPKDALEREIWMGRAAMLDAIYYNPDAGLRYQQACQ